MKINKYKKLNLIRDSLVLSLSLSCNKGLPFSNREFIQYKVHKSSPLDCLVCLGNAYEELSRLIILREMLLRTKCIQELLCKKGPDRERNIDASIKTRTAKMITNISAK